jgi:hypothetical protein
MKWLGNLIAMIFGSALYLGMMILMVLSLPFNVIALMRWMGWEWWSALLAAGLLNLIPGRWAGRLPYSRYRGRLLLCRGWLQLAASGSSNGGSH